MPRSVIGQSFRDLQKPALICGAILALYSFLALAFYPVLTAYPDFAAWFQGMTSAFQRLAGIVEPVATPAGFLNTAFFALVLPAALAAFSILAIDRIFNREREGGMFDILLAQPLPRWRLGLHKFAAVALSSAIVAILLWAIFAWRTTALGMAVNLLRLAEVMVCAALVGLCFGGLTMIFGALTGHARLSRALAWVGLFLAYLFFLTPQLAPGLKFIHLLSPFWYFFDADPLSNGVNLLHVTVLVLFTALTLIAALAIFEKADLMEAGD